MRPLLAPLARLAILAALAAGLGACKKEKSFDERYADAQASIGATAKDIDAQLDASEAAIDDLPTEGATAAP